MLSTGNDIVALNAINVTRTKQPNFYSKILTPTETELYRSPRFATIHFEVFVWLLWSIKESAFKFLQRIDADVLFTPVKFEVSDVELPAGFDLLNFDKVLLTGIGFDELDSIRAMVKFGDSILYSNSLIYREFICSFVHDTKDFSQVHWGIKRIDNDAAEVQSTEVRAFLADNFDEPGVIISKKKRDIPVLLINGIELAVPVSLSHHDKFISYCFVIL